MTATTDTPRAAAPWHFWVLAVVGLLWSAVGGFDYTMSHVRGEAYYKQSGMTDAQIAFFNGYPVWMHAVWAIGVWGSVAGAILMLLRSRFSMHAYALSTLGAIGALAYAAVVPQGPEKMALLLPVIIVAVCVFFVWYASHMTKRGVLR